MHRKPHLPNKLCAVCGLPFAWRRKWARDWDQVRYCSERCRRQRAHTGGTGAPTATLAPPRR
ncbi:DUF2256 domain-containing protein [Tepidimonas sp.]